MGSRLMGVLRILGLLYLLSDTTKSGAGHAQVMDSQSISTDKTRAPSLASKAANGRPTTSDLKIISDVPTTSLIRPREIPGVGTGIGIGIGTRIKEDMYVYVPVNNGDNLPTGPITIP